MFRNLSLVVVLAATNVNADVLAKGSDARVHVVTNQDQTASFYYCKSADNTTCKFLGPKERYTKEEIELVQKRLSKQVRRGIASDLTHFALSAGVAALTAVLTTVNPTLGAITIKSLMAAAGSVVVLVKGWIFPDPNHPRMKWRLVRAVKPDSLAGKDSYVREPMADFAKRLDEALKTLTVSQPRA